MKTTCEFCHTEYNANAAPGARVQCAVCGHTWTVAHPNRRGAILVIIAATCALLSAIVFTAAVITRHKMGADRFRPLVANVTDVTTTTDVSGTAHFVVNGTVTNQTDQIYGVPDLIIVAYDASGNVVARQKFLPSATLLDSGATTTFSHTLAAPTTGIKKITATLMEPGEN